MSDDTPNGLAIALIIATAFFMVTLDASVLLTALPAMGRAFHVAPVRLSAGISGFILVQAALLPAASWISDRLGARSVFAAAIAGFTIASLLCALSRSLEAFVAARLLQGAVAALMLPVGRTVLLHSVRKRDLVAMMNISTTPGLIAPAIGPAIGGLLVTYASWPWIFLLNIPIGIAGIAAALRYIPNLRDPVRRPFDVAGFFLSGGAIICLFLGLEGLSNPGQAVAVNAALLAAGLILGAIGARHMLRTPHPIISLASLKVKTFVVANFTGGALVRLASRGTPFVLPLMFQVALGMNALKAGILVLALSVGDVAVKFATTGAFRRFGFRHVMVRATIFAAVSVAACIAIGPDTPAAAIFAILLLGGMFRSFVLSGLNGLAYADVPRAAFSDAASLTALSQQLVNGLSVSATAIVLGVSSFALGHSGHLTLADCQIALALMALSTFMAAFAFASLPSHAGSALSGHEHMSVETDIASISQTE